MLSQPRQRRFAPEARRKLAGGGTAGIPVVIDLRPGRGEGSERGEKKIRNSKFRPAPLPGRDRSAPSYRRFHRRLEQISIACTGKWRDHWYSTGSVSDLSLDQ